MYRYPIYIIYLYTYDMFWAYIYIYVYVCIDIVLIVKVHIPNTYTTMPCAHKNILHLSFFVAAPYAIE